MKTDYKELEGKKVTLILGPNQEVPCTVAGCHYSIGITLVNSKDKTVECCLDSRNYPNRSKYKKHFFEDIKSIRNGIMVLTAQNSEKGGLNIDNQCPFNQ